MSNDMTLCRRCACQVTRYHRVVAYTEIRDGHFDHDIRCNQCLRCRKHAGEEVKFFCRNCEEVICRECRVSVHDKHQCTDLEQASDRYRAQMETLLTAVKGKIPALQQYRTFLSNYNGYIDEVQDQLAAQIESQAANLHQLVDEQKLVMINTLMAAASKERERADLRHAQCGDALEKLESTAVVTQQLLHLGRPEEILDIRKLVLERLKMAAHLATHPIHTKLSVYFAPGTPSLDTVGAIFGKLDVYNVAFNSESMQAVCKEPVHTMTPLSMGDNVKMVSCFNSSTATDVKDVYPSGIDVDHHGNMVILDRENRCVKVFDPTGTLCRTLGRGYNDCGAALGCPFDVCVLKNGNIAVSDCGTEQIKIFGSDGNYISSLSGHNKYPRGVAVDQYGRLVVVDCHCRRLQFYNPDTGALEHVLEGKGDDGRDLFIDPYYVCSTGNGRVVVTDWVAPNVKIFDIASGRRTACYGTPGGQHADHLLQPHGICCDVYGNIFVVDHSHHRIHMLSSNGKFLRYVVTRQHGLSHPMAVTINNQGCLVVTEALGKVKAFKYV